MFFYQRRIFKLYAVFASVMKNYALLTFVGQRIFLVLQYLCIGKSFESCSNLHHLYLRVEAEN